MHEQPTTQSLDSVLAELEKAMPAGSYATLELDTEIPRHSVLVFLYGNYPHPMTRRVQVSHEVYVLRADGANLAAAAATVLENLRVVLAETEAVAA